MRRFGLVLVGLLACLLVVSPAAAVADAAAPSAVLAVDGEPAGPNPMPRDAEDNPARELGGYEDREVQFTWGASWILLFLGLVGLVVMGVIYYFRVQRASDEASSRR